jgi:hypothetical protein
MVMTGVQPQLESANLRWHKSSFSAVGNCVEVARNGNQILVRDSTDPLGPTLSYTGSEWDAFVQGVKQEEFDDPV